MVELGQKRGKATMNEEASSTQKVFSKDMLRPMSEPLWYVLKSCLREGKEKRPL